MTSLRLRLGTGHPPPTLWPGGEISLAGLIKLRVLPTDQQSLRITLLERDGFPHKAGGERFRGGSLKSSSSSSCWFGDRSLERKHTNLGLLQSSLSNNGFCFPRKAAAVCIDWFDRHIVWLCRKRVFQFCPRNLWTDVPGHI